MAEIRPVSEYPMLPAPGRPDPHALANHQAALISMLVREMGDFGFAINRLIKRTRFGTLADRPSASEADRFYFATDTKELYYDDGSSWTLITATPAAHTHTISEITDLVLGKTIGDVPQYEDDGSGNPVVDHPNPPRVNGEAIRPEWILVEEKVLSAEALDHTFSGLDGDTDGLYKVTYEGVLPAGGGTYPDDNHILLQFNGDTTAGNYEDMHHRFWYSSGVNHDVQQYGYEGIELCRIDFATAGRTIGEAVLSVRQGSGERVCQKRHVFSPEGSTKRIHYNSVELYNGNQGSNITSIRAFWSNGTGDNLTGVLRLFKPGF